MSQTSLQTYMNKAFAGMYADASAHDVRSFVSAEASAEMPFGVMLAQGTNDGDAILVASSGAKLVGVLLHSHRYNKGVDVANGSTGELGSTGLKPKTQLNVLNKGRVWVTVEEDVAAEDRAYVRYSANGGNTQKGAFRKSDDAGHTIDATAVAKFVTSASAGGLAMVEIDMMNA